MSLPDIKEEMTLGELTQAFQSLMTILEEGEGLITEEIDKSLTTLSEKTAKKIDGYKFLMDKLESEAEFWQKQAQQRLSIAKRCDAACDFLKMKLESAMKTLEIDELQGNAFRAKLVPSSSVVVHDQHMIPEQFKKTTVTVDISKTAIKDAIKDGKEVPGAHIEVNKHIRFYTGKGK